MLIIYNIIMAICLFALGFQSCAFILVGVKLHLEEKKGSKRMTQLTTNPEKIKRLADKMRAMNDEELVHYVENRIRKAEAEAAGKKNKYEGLYIDRSRR